VVLAEKLHERNQQLLGKPALIPVQHIESPPLHRDCMIGLCSLLCTAPYVRVLIVSP